MSAPWRMGWGWWRKGASVHGRAAPDGDSPPGPLAERLETVHAELGRLGREHFRVVTLLESQAATLDDLAEAIREQLGRSEAEAADIRRALSQAGARARVEWLRDLLPVADALDASLRGAQALLAETPTPPDPPPSTRPAWLAALLGQPPITVAARPPALEAWLEGLRLARERLLALLERDGVQPMAPIGGPFDPHRHLAVATRADPDAPDGTVVGEELRGYAIGERVLRPAEVVVARRQGSHTNRTEVVAAR